MKKVLVLAVLVATLLGCSENKLTVENRSDFAVYLNFRAEDHYVARRTDATAPNSITVTTIPNGTYTYNTIYVVNDDSKEVVPGEGLAGEMTFQRSDTEILLIYGSTVSEIDSNGTKTYNLWGTTSSNQSTATGALVSP